MWYSSPRKLKPCKAGRWAKESAYTPCDNKIRESRRVNSRRTAKCSHAHYIGFCFSAAWLSFAGVAGCRVNRQKKIVGSGRQRSKILRGYCIQTAGLAIAMDKLSGLPYR